MEINNLNIKYLKEEFGNQLQIILSKNEKTVLAFLNFAKVLGCFENKKLVNFFGKEINTIVGQKASLFLKNIINDGIVGIDDFSNYFGNLQDVNYNSNFFNFLTMQEGKNKYQMLNTLLVLEKDKKGNILSVIEHFDLIKSMRKTLDDAGNPVVLSWENAIKRFNNVKKYENITSENIDIAELFLKFGLPRTTFDLASKIRQQAKQLEIKNHILNVELKENPILQELDKIEYQEANRDLIRNLYDKKFTFEFLNKHDPINYILGLYTDCCATINSADYGQKITKSAILSNEVQNIIIKDTYNNLVAKATIYVNKELGYAVINEFDINLKYREKEVITENNRGGWYNVTENSPEEVERQKIFDAFMRAINSFVVEFNNENSQHKLKRVNVGMGNNKLKKQLSSFQKEQNLLEVPNEFGFQDASNAQYVLFEKTNKNEINQYFER